MGMVDCRGGLVTASAVSAFTSTTCAAWFGLRLRLCLRRLDIESNISSKILIQMASAHTPQSMLDHDHVREKLKQLQEKEQDWEEKRELRRQLQQEIEES